MSVKDVSYDQGGFVFVNFVRSGYDAQGENNIITELYPNMSIRLQYMSVDSYNIIDNKQINSNNNNIDIFYNYIIYIDEFENIKSLLDEVKKLHNDNFDLFLKCVLKYTIAPLVPSDLGQSSYTPPILESKNRIPVIANSTDSLFITAKVLQGSARVSNLKLFYANGLMTPAFDSVTMTRNVLPNDTMVWFGKIPPYANGSVVKYFIKLTDANNFANYAPDTFATNSNYVIMDGGPQSIKSHPGKKSTRPP